MVAEHEQEVSQLQAAARRQDRLAEEKLRRAEEQIASMTQARQQLDNKVSTHLHSLLALRALLCTTHWCMCGQSCRRGQQAPVGCMPP